LDKREEELKITNNSSNCKCIYKLSSRNNITILFVFSKSAQQLASSTEQVLSAALFLPRHSSWNSTGISENSSNAILHLDMYKRKHILSTLKSNLKFSFCFFFQFMCFCMFWMFLAVWVYSFKRAVWWCLVFQSSIASCFHQHPTSSGLDRRIKHSSIYNRLIQQSCNSIIEF